MLFFLALYTLNSIIFYDYLKNKSWNEAANGMIFYLLNLRWTPISYKEIISKNSTLILRSENTLFNLIFSVGITKLN